MTERDQDQPDVGEALLRQYACGKCGAQPGQPCRGDDGNPWRFSHAVRHPAITSTSPLTVVTSLDAATLQDVRVMPAGEVITTERFPLGDAVQDLGALSVAAHGERWAATTSVPSPAARTQPINLPDVSQPQPALSEPQDAAQPVDVARIDLALAREAMRVRTPEQLAVASLAAAADRLDLAVDGITRVIAAHLPGWRGHEQTCMGCDWAGSFHGRHLAATIADWLRDNPGHAVAMVGRPA